MKKISVFLAVLILLVQAYAQSVAINETGAPPDSSAILDLSSISKGLLIPRLNSTQMNMIGGPRKGLLIFNLTTNSFWSNFGTTVSPNWQPLTANTWAITGNSGTNPATHFIGTSDNNPLVFRTNNFFSGGIDPADYNISLGFRAGESLTTGQRNTALGSFAMRLNQTSGSNVALGDSSLYALNGGNGRNAVIGAGAGRRMSTGTNNCFLGYQAGHETTVGRRNISVGVLSMYHNEDGYSNVVIGYRAMHESTSDSNNVVIGNEAFTNGTYDDSYSRRNVIIGDSAYYSQYYGASFNTIIGHGAARSAAYGSSNTLIGYHAMAHSGFLGSWNVAVGYQSLFLAESGTGNVALGKQTLYNNMTGGNYNVAIGSEAFYDNTLGYDGIAIGQEACRSNTAGYENIGIGKYALYSNTEADRNVAIGDSALYDLDNGGGQNTAIGSRAGYSLTTGDHNCFMGSQAARLSTTGDYNIAIGYLAMEESLAGDGNTCVGRQAADMNELGINNTLIGSFTDVDADGYISSTALGYNAAITASNQVRLGYIVTSSIGGYQNWSNISDGRYKRNVHENVPGLDFIMKLKPVTYQLDISKLQDRFDNDTAEDPLSAAQSAAQWRSGFIAQEVEEAAREVGYNFSGVDAPKNETDMYGLRYAEFVIPLVKAIQEQQEQIALLQQQNAELLARLDVIENANRGSLLSGK